MFCDYEGLSCLPGMVWTSSPAGSFGSGIGTLIPFVAIIAIMYFLMIRPQQKKEKQRQEMVSSLKRGDRVLTTGGLVGTVHKVIGDGEILLEVAEGVRVRLLSGAVTQLLDKTAQPHPADDSAEEQTTKAQKTKKESVKKASTAKRAPKAKAETGDKAATKRKKASSE